jgi:hypothetical protein
MNVSPGFVMTPGRPVSVRKACGEKAASTVEILAKARRGCQSKRPLAGHLR